MSQSFSFKKDKSEQLVVLAGPCMAESFEIMDAVAKELVPHSQAHNYELVFKASFDKANRTSIHSERGPGLKQAAQWFGDIKTKYNVPFVTDIHETSQVSAAAEVVDVLQIPAFLCRQTDLLVAAVQTGRAVNVKKGQFLAPESAKHIVTKASEVATEKSLPMNLGLTERGASFGYGDLVVDMRGFKTMRSFGVPVIFDVTHSCQKPASGGASGEITGGARAFAPLLARSAISSGYVDGVFLEVHPDPSQAKSDAQVQLSIQQALPLIEQLVALKKASVTFDGVDQVFS